jgi:hypothetical protein
MNGHVNSNNMIPNNMNYNNMNMQQQQQMGGRMMPQQMQQPQVMNRMNILFYSRKCQTSGKLVTIMQNYGLLQYFRMVCVDENLAAIPQGITEVPTLIVSGINDILGPTKAFQWVNSAKFLQEERDKKKVLYNMMKLNSQTGQGPSAVIDLEMTGFSDNYAFQDENANFALPKSFLTYDSKGQAEADNAIYTAPFDKKKDVINKQEQAKRIKELEADRKTQDGGYKDQMKDAQRLAYIRMKQQELLN